MSNKLPLTKANIWSLPLPEGGKPNAVYFDSETRGLGVRVSKGGARSFFVNYRIDGRERRYTLGRCSKEENTGHNLASARKAAAKIRADAEEGRDPLEKRTAVRKSPTVEDLCKLYIELQAKPNKKSWDYDERVLKAHLIPRFGKMKAAKVKRRDLLNMHDEISAKGHKVAANRAIAVSRIMFNWAMDREYIETSPAIRMKLHREESSDVVLPDNLVKTFWEHLEAATTEIKTPLRTLLQMQLVTGQRHEELRELRWENVESDWVTFLDTKNGLDHRCPLSPLAQSLIERMREYKERREHVTKRQPYSPYVFPGLGGKKMDAGAPSRAVNRIRKECALPEGFTPHKMRTTMTTGLARLGYPNYVIDRLTNHKPPKLERTYNKYDYADEKMQMACRWADELERLIEGKTRKISHISEAVA